MGIVLGSLTFLGQRTGTQVKMIFLHFGSEAEIKGDSRNQRWQNPLLQVVFWAFLPQQKVGTALSQRKNENQHKSSCIDVPTFCGLL